MRVRAVGAVEWLAMACSRDIVTSPEGIDLYTHHLFNRHTLSHPTPLPRQSLGYPASPDQHLSCVFQYQHPPGQWLYQRIGLPSFTIASNRFLIGSSYSAVFFIHLHYLQSYFFSCAFSLFAVLRFQRWESVFLSFDVKVLLHVTVFPGFNLYNFCCS